MSSVARLVALFVLATLTVASTGCGGNAKKLVGKWKVTSIGGQSKEKEAEGMTLILEFKADGTGGAMIEATDAKAQEFVKMINEKMPTFKWTVKGDKLELTNNAKDAKSEGIFGKKEKGTATMKFEGDNLTLTPDEAGEKTVTLTRMK